MFKKTSNKYPSYLQLDHMDCGPTCLKMIAKFYNKDVNLSNLRDWCSIEKGGVSFDGLSDAAEHIHLNSIPVFLPFQTLIDKVPLPCIAHWDQNHFVVIYEASNKKVLVSDPKIGLLTYNTAEFISHWSNSENDNNEGHLLLLEPTGAFREEKLNQQKPDFKFLWRYFKEYKKQIRELIIGMIFASFLQLILPFLTQAVVDYGINLKDLNFIYLILIAQIVMFISRASVELIRGWILLHLTTKVNIRLISDFLLKLIALPISYFDNRNAGDIIQRITDNYKIQTFLSSTSLTTLFSFVNIIVFGFVLWFYSWKIYLVFLLGSLLYIIWSLNFFKRRAHLDHQVFNINAKTQNNLFELVSGIEDIKLNGSQRKRRWKWEQLQINLFKVNAKSLKLEQKQGYGSILINELTNIFITFLAATAVIDGNMTLGMLLAVQYILGQLNAPLIGLTNFLTVAQDAKLSLNRLLEASHQTSEEDLFPKSSSNPLEGNINLSNVSFRYGPKSNPLVLDNINVTFNKNKTTAIVGVSGSGKTTLFKLILHYYNNYQGSISFGKDNLNSVSPDNLRSQCGVVMQDGFIFNDTISSNICESEPRHDIDLKKLKKAVEIANLTNFIDSLPHGYDTVLGDSGVSLSGGEKQRLFIARAIYKDPEYLFFDEATSALDANNEKEIVAKLDEFKESKTVLIIAHRLSTVKKADKIVVLNLGKIVEQGTHDDLIKLKGYYYTLVSNQLELGS